MQDRIIIDEILNELSSVSISVIEREYQVTKDYRCDALMEVKHDGISFLVCLDVPFNAIHDERTSKLPFPHISIDTSTPISVHDYDPSKKVFDISISYNDLGILGHIQEIREIPEYIHHTLRDWNVLDEVSQLSDSNQFGRKINPTNKRPAPFTKPQNTFPNIDDKDDTPDPTASAQFHNDTPAWVDAPSEKPGLGFDHIAASIVGLIDELCEETKSQTSSSPNSPLMTIGLYGPWGAGKSTLIRALQNEFKSADRKEKKKDYLTATINPWKWNGKGTLHTYVYNAFMKQARDAYPYPMRFVPVMRWVRTIGSLPLAAVLYIIIFGLLFFTGIVSFTGAGKLISTLGGLTSLVLIPLMSFGGKKVGGIIEKKYFSGRSTDLDADGLATAYQDIATAIRSQDDNCRPFVFFFDDLDRCPPMLIADFAESVHSLTAAGCVTFISCDENYVAAALKSRHNDILQHFDDEETRKNFGRKFLEKIVQIPYRVPSVQEKHLKELGIALPRQSLHISNSPEPTALEDSEKAPIVTVTKSKGDHEQASSPEVLSVNNQISTLMDRTAELFDLSKSDIKELHDLIIDAIKQTSTSIETNVNLIAAFIVADRYMPNWLDAYTGHSGNEPKLPPESEDLIEILKSYLGEDKAPLLALYDRVSMRLPNIMNWLLTDAVEPLRLNIRQIKALSNTINLHLRISKVLSEPDAKKIAAFILADMHDPDWLDRLYHGLDRSGTEIGMFEVLDKRLHDVLGEDKEGLLVLYGQLGRQPKQKSSFDPPPKSEND